MASSLRLAFAPLALVLAVAACRDNPDRPSTTKGADEADDVDPCITSGGDDECDWGDGDTDEGQCEFCAEHEACIDGVCQPIDCSDHADCPQQARCLAGTCAPIPVASECEPWPFALLDVPDLGSIKAMTFADLDADGAEEFVRLGPGGVVVLEADGTTIESPWLDPATFDHVIALHVDDDGVLDLAFLADGDSQLRTQLGLGDETFAAPVDNWIVPLRDIHAVDLDLDGQDELIGLADGQLTRVDGVGEGAVLSALFEPPASGEHLVLGDVDADGDVDLALLRGSPVDPPVRGQWYLQDAGAWVDGQGRTPHAITQGEQWLALDVDGDGAARLVVTGQPTWWSATLIESWDTAPSRLETLDAAVPQWLFAAELDGTPGQELIVATTPTPLVFDRVGEPGIDCAHPLTAFDSPDRVAAGDLDGDGVDELATVVAGVLQLWGAG